jgi:hypothetical protein
LVHTVTFSTQDGMLSPNPTATTPITASIGGFSFTPCAFGYAAGRRHLQQDHELGRGSNHLEAVAGDYVGDHLSRC